MFQSQSVHKISCHHFNLKLQFYIFSSKVFFYLGNYSFPYVTRQNEEKNVWFQLYFSLRQISFSFHLWFCLKKLNSSNCQICLASVSSSSRLAEEFGSLLFKLLFILQN